MWYIHYVLHFTITHSFFKRQYQMCSKLHQPFWIFFNGYMFKTHCSSLEHKLKTFHACFNEQKGNKNFTFPISDNRLLSSSEQLKIGHKSLGFQSNMRKYAISIPGVLFPGVCLVDWCLKKSLWIYSQIQQNKKNI